MFVPRSIAALATHTDPDSTRYALGAIRFERDAQGKPHAIATDGRRLLAVTWAEVEAPAPGVDTSRVDNFETLLPAKAIQSIAKAVKPKSSELWSKPELAYFTIEESTANGRVNLIASNSESTSREVVNSIDGRFPRWRDVLPNYDTAAAAAINPSGQQPSANEFAVSDCVRHALAWEESIRQTKGESLTDEERAELKRDFQAAAKADLQKSRASAFGRLFDYIRGGAVSITLDPRYIAEACKAVGDLACSDASRGVTFTVPLDASRPAVIEKSGQNGIEARTIVMPLASER